MKEFADLYDRFLIRSANSVYDPAFAEAICAAPLREWFENDMFSCQEEYGRRYLAWILSSRHNRFAGLESFPFRYLVNGVTQSLDEFHFRHRRRKIVMARGEYPYNRDVLGGDFTYGEDFIDERGLREGDALILSCPFSATGDRHPRMDEWLDRAADLGVPVLIDCAFFGTCGGVEARLDHPAVEAVAFSLTKGLGTGVFRSGLEFSRVSTGHVKIQNDWSHNLLGNARIGIHLMDLFPPDYIYDKYRAAQLGTCARYGLQPSKTIHLALGGEGWEYFSRDKVCNRIGIKNAVAQEYKRLLTQGFEAGPEASR